MGHSSFQEGYNYYFWEDDEYDQKVMAQREELDQATREQLMKECQQIFHDRGPSTFLMYPHKTIPWNSDRWEGVVELNGMGAANMLTFSQMEPMGDRKELNIAYDQQLQALNPFDQSGEIDMIQHRMIWDRLAWPDESALPQPRLAEEFNWKDETTLEVPIKQGHTFHDGEPVTAEDVKYSYDIHRNYSTYFSGPVEPVNEITVVDDHTVEFSFDYHFAPFPMAAMGRIAIIPKHKWTDIIENRMEVENPMLYQEDTPLGSGPMEFVHWRSSEEVRLERFDDHFDPIAYEARNSDHPQRPDDADSTRERHAGHAGELPRRQRRAEGSRGGQRQPHHGLHDDGRVQADLLQQRPTPFHIDGFRRAMNHRFDKETIVNDIYSGWGSIAPNTLVSSALKNWHNDELERYEFSLQAAANELVKAGFVWEESDGMLYMPADNTEVGN